MPTFDRKKLVECDNRVTVYRRKKDGNFVVMIWLPGASTYTVRDKPLYIDSHKVYDEALAISTARSLYYKLLSGVGDEAIGFKPFAPRTFKQVARDFLEEEKGRVDLGEITYGTYQHHKTYLEDYWIPYIGSKPVNAITDMHLKGFYKYRKKLVEERSAKGIEDKRTKVDMTPRAHKGYVDTLYTVLNYGVKKRQLNDVDKPTWKPDFDQVRRSTFDIETFYHLLQKLNDWVRDVPVGERHTRRVRFTRKLFQAYFQFMAGTGLRIGEARIMRFKHVSPLHHDETTGQYWMNVYVPKMGLDGKKLKSGAGRTFPCVQLGAAGKLMLETVYSEYELPTGPDNFLFQTHAGGYRCKDFEKQWNEFMAWLLRSEGIDYRCDPVTDERITVYSLRHYYASERIIAGTPWEELADNMGHSDTNMLREYYVNVKSSDRVSRSIQPVNKIAQSEIQHLKNIAPLNKRP